MALPTLVGPAAAAQQALLGPVNAAGGLFKTLAKDITDLNAPMSAALTNIKAFTGATTALGGAIGEFVKAANPAVFQRFAFATRDLQASFGYALMPAMEFATKVVRSFADAIYTVSQPIAKLLDAVLKPMGEVLTTVVNTAGPLLNVFGMFVKVVGELVAPFASLLASFVKIVALPIQIVFSVLGKVLEILLIPLRLIAAAFKLIVDTIGGLINGVVGVVKRLFGVKDTADASVGAAATNASLGSVESFQSKALTAAFMSGKGPEEKGIWEQILDAIKALPKLIAEALSAIFEGVGAGLDRAGEAIGLPSAEDAFREMEERNISASRYVAERAGDLGIRASTAPARLARRFGDFLGGGVEE